MAALLAVPALSSCAFVKYDSKGDEEQVQIEDSGEVELDGMSAADVRLLINGAGDIDLSELKAESFDSDIKGIGSIKKPVLK